METQISYSALTNFFNQDVYGPIPLPATPTGAENRLINLASGYATSYNNDFLMTTDSSDDNQSELAIKMTLSKPEARKEVGLAYSQVADTLFDIYDHNNQVTRDFDFREEVYKSFISNIGYNNLFQFFKDQLRNEFITPSHYSYLIETIQYIVSGTRRLIQQSSWMPIIYHTDGDFVSVHKDLKKIMLSNSFKEILGLNTRLLVTYWVEKEGGIEDLVCFNKIVFGQTPNSHLQ